MEEAVRSVNCFMCRNPWLSRAVGSVVWVWRIPSISIPARYVHHVHHVHHARHELVFLEGFDFGGGCGKFD